MTWFYKGVPIEDDRIPPKAVGFLYLITLPDGRRYLGRKLLTKSHRRQKNLKVIKSRVESDWKDYWSSSPEIISLIEEKGTDGILREILMFAFNKSELIYLEEKAQYVLGVLETEEFCNTNIRAKLFYRVIKNIDTDELNSVLESVKSNKGTL